MNFKNFLNPQPKTGALEINDLDLKFAQIDNNQLKTFSVKLVNGVVQDGAIINRDKFSEALKSLHQQITNNPKKEIYTIVNLPDNNIYFQTFILPFLEGSNFEETVELNLKIASPIDYKNARVGWQMFERAKAEELSKADKVEILGAFVQDQIVNEIEEILAKEKFIPVATEFSALSLARTAVELGIGVDRQKNYILIYFSNNGLSFNLIVKGNLYFNHFISWRSISTEVREISKEIFQKLINEELKKILSFYKVRWAEPIEKILLILPSKEIEDNISQIISDSFPVAPLKLKKFQNISINWFSILGSVLRGLNRWEEDMEINLAHVATKEKLFQYKLIQFIGLWQKIILSFLGAMLLIFIGVDLFLSQSIQKGENNLLGSAINKQSPEQDKIISQINKINSHIDLALAADSKRTTIISSFLGKIKSLSASDKIQIQRIFVQNWKAPIFITGFATNNDAAIDFKNKLVNDSSFINVDLPITKITSVNGGVNFVVSFTLKNGL